MERIGSGRGLLTLKPAAVFVLASLLFTACAICFPSTVSAAFMDDAESDRLSIDMKSALALVMLQYEYDGSLPGVLEWITDFMQDLFSTGSKIGKYQRIGQMRNTYLQNYQRDHARPASVINPEMSGHGTAIAGAAAGYREPGSPTIYSELYRERENQFRRDIQRPAAENKAEAYKITEQAQDWIDGMNRASQNASGYLALIQAGTQEVNYLNMELAELRSDTMRQMDVQMRAAIEEAQDDFDNTSAFEGAVSTWKNHTGTGEY